MCKETFEEVLNRQADIYTDVYNQGENIPFIFYITKEVKSKNYVVKVRSRMWYAGEKTYQYQYQAIIESLAIIAHWCNSLNNANGALSALFKEAVEYETRDNDNM